jgi:hypothetical protein
MEHNIGDPVTSSDDTTSSAPSIYRATSEPSTSRGLSRARNLRDAREAGVDVVALSEVTGRVDCVRNVSEPWR